MTSPNNLSPDDKLPRDLLERDDASIADRLDALEIKLDQVIRNHYHNGISAQRINFSTDIIGLFETVSVAPTAVPKSPYDQIKIYVNSTTYRLYWYDNVGNAWHYVTATA